MSTLKIPVSNTEVTFTNADCGGKTPSITVCSFQQPKDDSGFAKELKNNFDDIMTMRNIFS